MSAVGMISCKALDWVQDIAAEKGRLETTVLLWGSNEPWKWGTLGGSWLLYITSYVLEFHRLQIETKVRLAADVSTCSNDV
jgi:hypothetical protein